MGTHGLSGTPPPPATDHAETPLSGRSALRKPLRAARRQLSEQAQAQAAIGLLTQLRRRPELRRARRIAVYLPQDGEIDPGPIAEWLYLHRRRVFLPVIDPIARGSQRLRFAPWHPDTCFRSNRFGIPEPIVTRTVPGWTLDLVLLPLVAFDARGNRLGMGGGFYDRSFDLRRSRGHRPRLIGLAHGFQEVAELSAARHDVPLHGIATEARFLAVAAAKEGAQ
ncbi:MAG: 5-formyltetrahydrofolate cyclo-ligase [Gammaproteobacteria bacterium]|nr:MAG: 5-formyltetrahydrofolate cyclo-ligase [Gammaproteobacteria bacterium]